MPYIRLFLLSINRKNGSLTNYPTGAGIFEQPNRKLQIFEYLQHMFIDKIIEEQKKLNRK